MPKITIHGFIQQEICNFTFRTSKGGTLDTFFFRKKTENKELLFNLASKMHEFSLNSCPILPPCSNLRYSKMNKSVTKSGHLIF